MTFTALLAYPPILRGFLVLLAAGGCFPLIGVFVLQLNLVPLRFTLMHGALLGGALALALGVDPLALGLAVCLLIVLAIAPLSRSSGLNAGYVTAFFMVLTIGLAYAVIYRAGVPAKDTLAILWGNLFALSPLDVTLTLGFAAAALLFVAFFFQSLKGLLFHPEVAYTAGISTTALTRAVLLLTGLTVAFSLKLVGALLLDALLLLPAIVATFFARSARSLFILAGLFGLGCSLAGFALALWLDLPASSGVTFAAALLFAGGLAARRLSTVKNLRRSMK